MKIDSNLRPYIGIAIGTVLTIVCFVLGAVWQCSRTPETPVETKTETVTKTDTVTLWKTKTVTISEPTPVYSTITRVEHDTLPVTKILHSRDTVYASVDVPISSQKYSGEETLSDSTKVSYVANVTGYRASLDSLQFKVTYPERHINTSTVTTTTSTKKKHWGIGPAIGVGYGLTSKKFDAYVGLSVTYSF